MCIKAAGSARRSLTSDIRRCMRRVLSHGHACTSSKGLLHIHLQMRLTACVCNPSCMQAACQSMQAFRLPRCGRLLSKTKRSYCVRCTQGLFTCKPCSSLWVLQQPLCSVRVYFVMPSCNCGANKPPLSALHTAPHDWTRLRFNHTCKVAANFFWHN